MAILKTWKGEPTDWVEVSTKAALERLGHYGDEKTILSILDEGQELQSPFAWYKKKT